MMPKLRFSEFNMPWKQTTLGSVSSHAAYGMNSSAIEFDGVNKYIRITDIDDDTREFTPSPLTTPSGKLENQYLLNKGDIVFARTGASVGKSYLYKQKDGRLYFAGFLIKLTINKANPYFVYNQTLTEKYRKWVKIYSMRSGQPGINAEEYKEFEFAIPSLEEQTKIADFLSSVDEKIALLKKQYDLLCQYKKGMMQKIFSQELRFKDENGEVFPEWSETLLGDIATFYNGRAYKQTEWENNGTPVIRLQNLTGSGTEYYYSNLILPDHQYCDNGDLLYMWSATMGPVWWKGPKAIFHYHIWKIVSINGKSVEGFLYYILDYITQRMLNEANGTTMAHITKSGIEKECVYLPSLREQTKIANFLSYLDDKIAAKKTELDKLKTWKQGLLQQMFI
ncbi:restriction endonuclease subunit S [Citrobacter sp. Cb009]|uniref:restriction endonuclease subunit S n=1 Tax=Citrobacter sp. Cb009 TaxID=2985010 RepID=UPI00257855EA|nr:restriction endonuclease subunit S [Citrobacter sp. Cb009]MDM3445661.1 restriction endonuclease subunit S [Citrobacter sp. Cb009]